MKMLESIANEFIVKAGDMMTNYSSTEPITYDINYGKWLLAASAGVVISGLALYYLKNINK